MSAYIVKQGVVPHFPGIRESRVTVATRVRPVRWLTTVLAVVWPLLLSACFGGDSSPSGSQPPSPPGPPPSATRDRLTANDLLGTAPPGVVHNGYFEPQGTLQTVANTLCGTLHFSDTRMATTHPDADWRGGGMTLFPAFSLPVITRDDWLIPLERDLILSGHGSGGSGQSVWNVIASPGRVWQEAADGGYSRATLLLTFTDNYVGHARNGLATFVFDNAGISSVAFQITQETAPVEEHLRVDFSALVPVTWDPTCPVGAEEAVTAFQQELADRLPLRAWSELPSATTAQVTLRSGFADTDFSGVALLMDGQLYQQEVATRSGPQPWPEWMRHGVYSVTKTLGLGLSMLYLADRYGDAVFNERITDYVPQLAGHPGWQGVTFHHTLNMVTGVTGGERGAAIGPYVLARSAASKLSAINALPDAPAAPGTQFAYYSTHSFVLSQAMNNYVKAREGPTADYWAMVQDDVLRPIGVHYLPISRSFEGAGVLGTPIMGWGSYPDVDAAAKIAQLLQDNGMHEGQQLLSLTKTREAMRRTGNPGYATPSPIERIAWSGRKSVSYLHSVWTVRTNTGRCDVNVPMMSGYGGNHVMMLPSGLSVVRFMDADDYEVRNTVRAVETYRSSC
jgi:hypothetical protein